MPHPRAHVWTAALSGAVPMPVALVFLHTFPPTGECMSMCEPGFNQTVLAVATLLGGGAAAGLLAGALLWRKGRASGTRWVVGAAALLGIATALPGVTIFTMFAFVDPYPWPVFGVACLGALAALRLHRRAPTER